MSPRRINLAILIALDVMWSYVTDLAHVVRRVWKERK